MPNLKNWHISLQSNFVYPKTKSFDTFNLSSNGIYLIKAPYYLINTVLLIPHIFWVEIIGALAPTPSIGMSFKPSLKERSSDTVYLTVFERCTFAAF